MVRRLRIFRSRIGFLGSQTMAATTAVDLSLGGHCSVVGLCQLLLVFRRRPLDPWRLGKVDNPRWLSQLVEHDCCQVNPSLRVIEDLAVR